MSDSNIKNGVSVTRTKMFGMAGISGAVLALAAFPAAAQDASANGEIVVTARRVEEKLQDVPVAVTVFSGQQLEQQGTVRVSDLASFTPGFGSRTAQSSPTAASFVIRGQVQTDILATLDPSVGTYVDGVYWARAYGLNGDLLDVKSAQVLRGPQGTLFGRNTSAGAIVIETNKPNLTKFTTSVGLTVGDYGRRMATGVINIPIVEDQLALRVALQDNVRDGYITNAFTGEKVNDNEAFTGRARLLWAPTDTVTAMLNYEHYRTDSMAGARVLLLGAGLAAATAGVSSGNPAGGQAIIDAYRAGPLNTPGTDVLSNNADSTAFAETDTISGNVSMDIGNGVLQLTAAHREVSANANIDLDGTRFAVHETLGTQELEQNSYELQYSGDFADKLSYTLGALYFDESGTDKSSSSLLLSPAITKFSGTIDNSAWGVYGQGTYKVTDKLNVTAGVRYSSEDKGFVGNNTNVVKATGAVSCQVTGVASVTVANGCAFPFQKSFNSTNYTIGADYHITDDVMVYAKHSTGFRSGGHNLRATSLVNAQPFLAEDAGETEIGVRSDWFEKRLRLNVSAYDTEVENVQRSTLIAFTNPNGSPGTATILGNAAVLNIQGGELEATAKVTDSITLGATAAYTDASYGKYADASGDRSVERIQDVPEWTYTLSAAFDHDVPVGKLHLRADYAWTDEMALQPQINALDRNALGRDAAFIAATTRPSGGVVNARASLEFGEGKFEVAVFGTNLGDNRDLVQALTLPSPLLYTSGFYREPTMYGVSFKANFGE